VRWYSGPSRRTAIGALVFDRQLARVADDHGGEWRSGLCGRGRPGLLDVQCHGVHEVYLIALGGQRQRVGAGRATDVEHGGGRGGQHARQQLARAQELEPCPVAQATLLLSALVVGGDVALVGHARQRSPG
jgi:hypothetical protein